MRHLTGEGQRPPHVSPAGVATLAGTQGQPMQLSQGQSMPMPMSMPPIMAVMPGAMQAQYGQQLFTPHSLGSSGEQQQQQQGAMISEMISQLPMALPSAPPEQRHPLPQQALMPQLPQLPQLPLLPPLPPLPPPPRAADAPLVSSRA